MTLTAATLTMTEAAQEHSQARLTRWATGRKRLTESVWWDLRYSVLMTLSVLVQVHTYATASWTDVPTFEYVPRIVMMAATVFLTVMAVLSARHVLKQRRNAEQARLQGLAEQQWLSSKEVQDWMWLEEISDDHALTLHRMGVTPADTERYNNCWIDGNRLMKNAEQHYGIRVREGAYTGVHGEDMWLLLKKMQDRWPGAKQDWYPSFRVFDAALKILANTTGILEEQLAEVIMTGRQIGLDEQDLIGWMFVWKAADAADRRNAPPLKDLMAQTTSRYGTVAPPHRLWIPVLAGLSPTELTGQNVESAEIAFLLAFRAPTAAALAAAA